MRNLLFFLMLFGSAARAETPPDYSTRGQAPAHPDEKLKAQWEQRFRAADKDRSRSLDRAEADAGLPKVLSRSFDAIDTNHDDRITPAELWAMHEREVVAREKRRAARVAGPPR